MREGSYFSSMQEHYIGNVASCHFRFACFFLFFFPKRLDCLFGLSLFFMAAICHQGGERTLTGEPWRHPRNLPMVTPAATQFLEQRSWPSEADPNQPWQAPPWDRLGAPSMGQLYYNPVGQVAVSLPGGILTAPQVSMVFIATAPGPIAHLPN